jgi:drug/metabolite transporter (DMT)-like permease
LCVGFVSYGLSIVLDVYALRYAGAARESAYFATAPFAGAVAAVPLLGERLTATEVAAGSVMAAGIALLIAGRSSGLHESRAH